MNTNLILRAHPIDLVKSLDKVFIDQKWHSWEPEVLLTMLKDEISELAHDKVLSVQAVACNSSLVFEKAMALEKVVLAFCNNFVNVDVHQAPLVEELVYSIPQIEAIVKYVHPEAGPTIFTGDTIGYVAAVAKFRGWVVLPPMLSFAQDRLNFLTGIVPGSKKFTEFSGVISAISSLSEKLSGVDLTTFPEITDLLNDDSSAALMAKKVLGAYMYDPTVLYK